MRVALVNPNRIRPPIGPIGLEYVAEGLAAAGHRVEILDLCWEDRPEEAVARFFSRVDFGLVGISIRNTDDCSLATRESFLPVYAALVRHLRRHTDAPVVAGGVGFSVMPEEVLDRCGIDAGVRGDGEFVLARIADRIAEGQPWNDLPGLVARRDGRWRRNPPRHAPLIRLPPMGRDRVDNRRYFREGGQAGIETKRGCPRRCVYCADPVAKGRRVRLRPPSAVADELGRLLDQGIDHVHTCDSEFNAPEAHAAAVCREIIRRGQGGRLRWYAYCQPAPFSPELARLLARAGCRGINFGVDSGDEGMLARLGRDFSPGDILAAARLCRKHGMAVMFDLLVGSPGESRESVARTIGLMRRAAPDRVGVAVGVRIYPETALGKRLAAGTLGEGTASRDDPSGPIFFVEPAVASGLGELLDALIGGDPRFLFFDPGRPDRNYNYNANRVLVEAIARGFRGAYWDILRRCREG